MKRNDVSPDWIPELTSKIFGETSRFVVGKRDILDGLLIALLAGGHVLLEGVPGVAKTHIAKTFAGVLGCKYSRIQFTSDLLPVDIVGSFVFDQKTSEFKLRKGPIFSNIVLIDEINRGTPKTQSGTIEVMQERQVTIEGQTLPLQAPFMVIATRNPIESEGVFPLSEAQLDRFMLRLDIGYPSAEEERELIEQLGSIEKFDVELIISAQRIRELAEYVDKVHVSEDVKLYLINLVRQTRELKELKLGGSPRATLHLYKSCKARAFLEGRDYVIPDDVKYLIGSVLNHRMWLSREAEIEGLGINDLVRKLISETPIPSLRTVDTGR
jgi:MoxR-like ATPase